jgi:fumarylacetoacetate (FAA) hydrolase
MGAGGAAAGRAVSTALNAGRAPRAMAFEPARCMAPLPRSFQWCDASAFLNHGRLMERAFNTAPIPDFETVPVMYQGASDDFLGPCDPVPMPDEALGIDFEGEFGVVVGDSVPMGVSPQEALGRVRLLVQVNDWSLRALGPREMKTGFGFLQAKPSTSFAPLAITPDELGRTGATAASSLTSKSNGTASLRPPERGRDEFRLRRTGRPCGAHPAPARRHHRRLRHRVECRA